MLDPENPDLVQILNENRGSFNELIGLRFVKASLDEVVAEVPISDKLQQPYGLVHGGVYSAIVETLCSSAGALYNHASGRRTVGLDNSTTFLRGARGGTLTGTATPLARGRRTQVWETTITDDDGRLVAKGRVRLLNLEDGSAIAGEKVQLPSEADKPARG